MSSYGKVAEISLADNITYEYILHTLSNGYEELLYRIYLGEEPKPGVKYFSRFSKEKTPSLSFYYKNGELKFKDFSSGHSGRLVDFIMAMYNITYVEALYRLYQDVTNKRIEVPTRKKLPTQDKEFCKIQVVVDEWNDNYYAYWKERLIKQSTLEFFEVAPCKEVWVKDYVYYRNTYDYIAYRYLVNGLYKIYAPLAPDKKKKFISNTDSNKCIQGFKQLTGKSKVLMITSSMKDVITLYELGIDSIAPTSENSLLPEGCIEYLVNKFQYKKVVILYDNDDPGLRAAQEHSIKYGVPYISLTDKQYKDPSDLVHAYQSLQPLRDDLLLLLKQV